MDDFQSPMSDPSFQAGNLATNTGSSRRSSSSVQKPTADDIHINLVMKMGFSRKAVELAIRTLRKFFLSKFKNCVKIMNESISFVILQDNKTSRQLLVELLNGSSSIRMNVI